MEMDVDEGARRVAVRGRGLAYRRWWRVGRLERYSGDERRSACSGEKGKKGEKGATESSSHVARGVSPPPFLDLFSRARRLLLNDDTSLIRYARALW